MLSRKQKFLFCFFSFLILLPFSVFSQKVIVVEAGKGWVDTGINISYNEYINVFAMGTATHGWPGTALTQPWVWSTPAGIGCPEPGQNCFVSTEIPWDALAGKIQSNGTPFFIGSNWCQNANSSGRLYLAINYDYNYVDRCYGFYVVFIYSKNILSKVGENSLSKPTSFSLEQNYPNPFNPETQIEYTLTERSPVILKIYTALGEEVKTLVDEVKLPGNYTAVWDGTDKSNLPVPSGQYFYQVTQNNQTVAKKAVLIR